MINKKHQWLGMGIVFTIMSLCLSLFTTVGFSISALSGIYIQRLMIQLLKNHYDHSGNLIIILLTIILVCTIVLSLIVIKKVVLKTDQFSRWKIAGLLSIIYLIIRPLSFLVYTRGYDFNQHIAWAFYETTYFDYSSFAFIPLGLLFDTVINKHLPPSSHTPD